MDNISQLRIKTPKTDEKEDEEDYKSSKTTSTFCCVVLISAAITGLNLLLLQAI